MDLAIKAAVEVGSNVERSTGIQLKAEIEQLFKDVAPELENIYKTE